MNKTIHTKALEELEELSGPFNSFFQGEFIINIVCLYWYLSSPFIA